MWFKDYKAKRSKQFSKLGALKNLNFSFFLPRPPPSFGLLRNANFIVAPLKIAVSWIHNF